METLEKRITELKSTERDRFVLSKNLAQTEAFLKRKGWVSSNRKLKKLMKPGEGNMNCVYRATFNDGYSFILKQARPWVEKYPDIDAPENRIAVEWSFYREIENIPGLKKYSPAVHEYDSIHKLMVIEDLGHASDFTSVYENGKTFSNSQITNCITFLNRLKEVNASEDFPENRGMRKLNHQHIFILPFKKENGFDLNAIQSGLKGLSLPIINDQELVTKVELYGDIYLGEGNQLVHGDFYPGSILETKKGLRVIDPEFSFVGPPEWDLAVFIAHLFMAESSKEQIRGAFHQYKRTSGFDIRQFSAFVGIEVIRRIIGLAQLPLSISLEKKEQLLNNAVDWIKSGNIDLL